jgi:hypothetical protein
MDRRIDIGAVQRGHVCTQARVISLDEEARTVRHVISTSALDRVGRIVEVSGWRLNHYRANPVVLADHDYSIERIIGCGIDTKVEGDALVSTTQFHEEGIGNVAFRLVQAGLGRAWSVGWQGIKAHFSDVIEGECSCKEVAKKAGRSYVLHYLQSELLEYSLVAIPANRDAVMGLQAAGLVKKAEVEEWIETTRRGLVADGIDAAARTAPEGTVETEALTVAAPIVRSPEVLAGLYDLRNTFGRTAAFTEAMGRLRK